MTDQIATTPERILAAAAEIFGREGFKAATVRRIADAAGANVAAINYHFRDKEGLYAAVLEDLFEKGFSRFPADSGVTDDSPADERLRSFIRAMFHRLLSREGWGGLAGPGRLIAREFLEPTPSFEPIIEKYIKPHKEMLIGILIRLMGRTPPPEVLASCCLSVIGQCIYYALGAPMIQRLTEHSQPTESNLDRLADFVWRFSVGGIEGIKNNLGNEFAFSDKMSFTDNPKENP